jgi:hypothetical protein
VVAKVREGLAVSKQTTHRVHMERFSLKKLNEVEVKEKYRFKISNRFEILEHLEHRVGDVRQIEIHTAEPLTPDPSPFEVEIAIENLKSYK